MKLLIVSPHFPPSNAADMQRVRLLLPWLRSVGVYAEVLAVEPAQVSVPLEPWLELGLPEGIPLHRVKALGQEWGMLPGLGTLTFRALRALRRKGDELLGKVESGKWKAEFGQEKGDREQRSGFDLVYFSTTQFGIHVLGPEWKRKFGVPFVMDYQDPWVSDYYREHPDVVPPGGRLKYAVSSWLSRRQEPQVLRDCSGITSVSAAYPGQLARRYGGEEIGNQKVESRNDTATAGEQSLPSIRKFQFSAFKSQLLSIVLPFPGDRRDLDRVKEDGTRQDIFDPNDGLVHWVYIGRGGADMAVAVRAIFGAIRSALDDPLDNASPSSSLDPRPSILDRLKLHFIGTSYAAAGQGIKTIEPLAAEFGLQDQVVEHPDRIPYSETLRCLLDADALIVPGSDDPAYTASKIYPYLLAGKPLLTVFHQESSVVRLVEEVGGAVMVAFATGESPADISKRIRAQWLDSGASAKLKPLDDAAFTPYTAKAQAEQLGEFFRKVLETCTCA